MLSVKSEASEKLDADSIGKSNNQEISKHLLLDNEQTVQQHNAENSLFVPSPPSYNNAGDTEVDLSADHFHSQQLGVSDDTTVTTKLQPAPVSAPVSIRLPESHDVAAVETSVPFIPTKDHQSQHTTSSSEAVQSDMLSQSELKPDAEPVEPRLEKNDEYVAHTFPSGFRANARS